MDSFFGTLAFVSVIHWFYRLGKSTGSPKGFNVRFSRGQRWTNGHYRNRR